MKLIDLWSKYTTFKARSLSFITIEKDFTRIRNHIAKLPSQRLKDARKIRKYLLDSFTAQTAKRVLMQINACCKWALAEELIATNPFAELPEIKGGQHKKLITQEEQVVEVPPTVTIRATRVNPKTNELEANADIVGEGLPCTLSLDAVEVVSE